MAVLGSAEIIVRAVTKDFKRQVEEGFKSAAPTAEKEGEKTSKAFGRGFSRGAGDGRSGIDRFIPRDFADRAERARIAFRNLNRVFTLAFPAIVGVGGAIGALGGGLVALVGLAGNAARSVGIVLVAALGALGQAGLAAVIALKGVSEAINAQSGGGNTAAEEAALKRLRDARIALRNIIEKEKPEELEQARQRAAEAADSAADAVLNAERAERGYFQAQKDTLNALEDLNDAREEAKERLQQLRFEVEGGAISEKRARIEFEKARESLQRVQDLPPNSRARQEAELAFAQADLNLRKAIDRNADLKKEENAATRAGVEGSDLVINAKERLSNAQQAETDAAIEAARAVRDASRAQAAAAQAAADAQAGGRVEQELDARIARAREALEEAEKAAKDAAGGGIDRFAEALAKLSPAAQRFVLTVRDNKKEFNDFKKTVQEPFFQEFNRSLFLLLDRLPALGDLFASTSGIVGRLASGFVDLFLGAENFGRTGRIFKTNDRLVEKLGQTFLNLVDGLLLLLDAAEPVIDAFGDWALQSSSGWLKNLQGDFDGVRERLEQSAEKAARLGGIFGGIRTIFKILGGEINEAGGAADILLGWLEKITTEGIANLEEQAASGDLKQFFIDVTENAIVVLEIIGNIITGLLTLGAQPGTKQFLASLNSSTDGLKGFSKEFGAENGPLASIGSFIESFFANFSALLQNESFTVFIDTLAEALDWVTEFLNENEDFLKAIAPILAYVLALGAIGSVIRGLFNVFSGFGLFVTRIFQGAGGIVGKFATGFKTGFAGLTTGPAVGMLRLLGIVGIVITAIMLMWQNSETFRTAIAGLFSAIGEAFSGVMSDLKTVFGEGTKGGEAIAQVFGFLGDVIGIALSGVATAIGFIIGIVGGALQFVGSIFVAIGNLFQGIQDVFMGVWALITGDTEKAGEYFNSAIGNFRKIFLNLGIGIGNFFISVINGIIDGWNGFVSKIKLPDWPIFGNMAGKSAEFLRINRIPPLQLLAQGGIVNPSAGGTMALIGEAGQAERVEPLDSSGLSKRDRAMIAMLAGNGPAINVYPAPGMNETELARKISREMASQMRRGSL